MQLLLLILMMMRRRRNAPRGGIQRGSLALPLVDDKVHYIVMFAFIYHVIGSQSLSDDPEESESDRFRAR